MTATMPKLTATQRDIITAMALGGIVLRRPGLPATLHCPDTGRTLSKLPSRSLANLISAGYLEGSNATKRGKLTGIMGLTPDGRALAESLLEGIGDAG